jgi:hypothetical protein
MLSSLLSWLISSDVRDLGIGLFSKFELSSEIEDEG